MRSNYILADCIEYMEELKKRGEKFNCIIVDPPYGIAHKSNRRKDKSDMTTRKGILNDKDNLDLLEKSLKLSYDLLEDKSHIYWFTKWTELDIQMPLLKKYYQLKNMLIWDKGNRGSGDLLGSYGNRYEVILFGTKGRRLLNVIDGKRRHDDILCFNKVPAKKLIHPHQKPLDLLEFLVKKSTNPNEKILDMFGGIGSTLIAAEKQGRICTCIELDEEVYKNGLTYIKENIK